MPVKLNSSGGGSVTLDTASTASDFTATFPAVTGNVVTTGSTAAVTPAMLTQPLTQSTAQASTSGTSIDFTGIPSWAKRITVMFNGVSTNGTSIKIVQIGAGSVTTSGYLSSSTTTGTTSSTSTTATGYNFGTNIVSDTINGIMTVATLGGNVWVSSHAAYANTTPQGVFGGGAVTLSGTLDRVRITTVGGTDTFDAGSINILYE
jgi:hypothetical protein